MDFFLVQGYQQPFLLIISIGITKLSGKYEFYDQRRTLHPFQTAPVY